MKKILPLLFLFVLLGAGCGTGAKKSTGSDGGVFKTVNSGTVWTQSSSVPTAKGIGTLTTANILTLSMDPEDASFLYAGTREDGFLYSDDAGASWHQPKDAALSTGFISAIKVDPKNVCTVYVAKGPRLYKSMNCMRTFQNDAYLESRSNVSVTRIAVDWFDPKTVWIGLSNGDVQKSTDSGKTWSNSMHAKDQIISIIVNQKDSRKILVATATNGMRKTEDGGATWTDVSDHTLPGAISVHDLVQSKDSGAVIAVTAYGLIRSKDFGTTWEQIKLVTAPGQVNIQTMGMDVAKPDVLYYATAATFYKSADGGLTWQTEKFPSTRLPRAILVDPTDSSVVYVGTATEVK